MFDIVIVTWNNLKQCKACVKSIQKESTYNHNIIVVHNEVKGTDNGIDGAMNIYFKGVNKGLSYAANFGSQFAKGEYLCLIDDDMLVTKNWDYCLKNAREVYEIEWLCSTMAEKDPPRYNINIDKYLDGKKPVGWYQNISNTPLLIPLKTWRKIGGYDEDFPVIGAELGLAKRAYDNGIRNFVQTPYSVVLHFKSQSISRMKNKVEERKRRDQVFQNKYGISRNEFINTIRKGKKLDFFV